MAALLSDGSVYNWGVRFCYYNKKLTYARLQVYRDANGILGFTGGQTKEQLEPKKVDLGNESVVQIASAENATLALTHTGHIYIWGAYRLQWRTSERTRAKVAALFPSRVLTTIKFDRISAGGMHFFARSVDGIWYSWGLNNWGQLGHGHAPAELEEEEAKHGQEPVKPNEVCRLLMCADEITSDFDCRVRNIKKESTLSLARSPSNGPLVLAK